jgi:hypothetical protein
MKVIELQTSSLDHLRQVARDLNVQGANRLKRDDSSCAEAYSRL